MKLLNGVIVNTSNTIIALSFTVSFLDDQLNFDSTYSAKYKEQNVKHSSTRYPQAIEPSFAPIPHIGFQWA